MTLTRWYLSQITPSQPAVLLLMRHAMPAFSIVAVIVVRNCRWSHMLLHHRRGNLGSICGISSLVAHPIMPKIKLHG
jgi:hypothetical protein